MTLILTALAAFLGTFAALALGWHLRLFGCHRREENDQPPASWLAKQEHRE
jgi:hypothetical protein